jgi:hypothetical protein
MVFSPSTPENFEVISEFTTPETRANYDTQISSSVRENVRDASDGGRCLVTNTKVSSVFCHCMPRRYMKDKELVCLSSIYSILVSNAYHSSGSLNGSGI